MNNACNPPDAACTACSEGNYGEDDMAESNLTKNALASALKQLMTELPFAKITIADICEQCQMNRKSFYYHFKDKYDLLNWIFDNEIIVVLQHAPGDSTLKLLEAICNYLYQNRSFYCAALETTGQNSFSEHFRDFLLPLVAEHLRATYSIPNIRQFQINFFTDGLVCSLERWIQQKDCIPPHELMEGLHACVVAIAHSVTDSDTFSST